VQDSLDGEPLFWRRAPGADVLYVHGVPTTADVWAPLLDRAGGVAPDLPGFGRTTKRGDLDFSIDGYTRWLDRFAEHAGLGRCAVVAHGWGAALALPWAAQHAARVVLLDPVPLLAGHRWSVLERALRTRGAGEMAIGLAIRPVLRRRLPRDVADESWPHFDQGTQRAILRLYRATEPDALAQAAARVAVPSLVVGDAAFADALGAESVPASPWAWRTDDALLERVAAFLRDA
jgi:pimeloyl-ACP methyl ester carboxylesterase